ncbi:MAG: restriction endonuclease subunit S [Deltaproteobacteria bacterium]|nr:restriction endonuclease subunit S [Deltaproteobacteria bacterium]
MGAGEGDHGGYGRAEGDVGMILHTLPQGWTWSTLTEIASPNKNAIVDGPFGSSLKTSDYRPNGVPVLQGKNITNSQFEWKEIRYISEEKADELKRSQVRIGDLLMIKIGSIGYSAYLDDLNGHDFAVIPANMAKISFDTKKVNKRYAWHWLNNPPSVRKLNSLSSKTAQSALNLTKIKTFPIPLPPLTEQKRIAAILDKADAIRRKRQAAIKLADDFLRATFLDMFGDPVTNPRGWPWGTLGDFIHSAKDGPHISPQYSTNGIPFLSTRHIRPGKIIWEDLKYISREEAKRQWLKCKPEKGDILYTKGGTTGIAAVFDSDQEIAVWVHVSLLKTNHKKAEPVWLESMLNTAYCYSQSQRFTHGITNQDLGLTRMVNIKTYSPPLELQKMFSRIVAKVKYTMANHRRQKEQASNLFNSLAQRAFRGEL